MLIDVELAEVSLPLDTENLLFRLKGGIELEGVTNKTDESGIKAGFKEAIKELISKVNSEAFVLNGFGGALYIWPKAHASTQPSELQDDTQCKAILKYVTVEVSDLLQKASNIQFLKIVPLKIINMQILFEMAQADNTEEVVIHHRRISHIHFKLVLPIDVVVLVKPEEPWGKVQDQFVEAVTEQLSAMDNCIQRYTNGKTVPIPQAFHFELPEKTTLTTVIYPAGISDANLEQQRKELQTELGLDNKPYFRRPMVYVFPSAEMETKYLRNVHRYIPALNPDDYKVSLVHGSYTFHHCLQDNEKDKKWGALYRCLQVVISWFKFQGYIDKPVPTVKEIREMLIKMDEEFVPIVLANEWLAPDEMIPFLEFYNISCSSTEERYFEQLAIAAKSTTNTEGLQNRSLKSNFHMKVVKQKTEEKTQESTDEVVKGTATTGWF
ncbi:ufm1-specific protease 2-like [Chiloscyllium punctatum]|uniref:ufm1-specific protease 2-like n=1 Tax=Chiloscyllium punctatum TaxID=137246 RepID=UPI003B642244